MHIIITCAFYIQNLHVVWGFNINSIKSYHKYQKSKSYNRKKLEFILNEISGNGWYVVETQPLSSDINLAFHLSNAMKNEKKFIRLDTSKGWGSGSHPTTRLCLDFITENVSTGMKVLDYGTGSGVLSIYAALSGASICYGVDVDEDSLITAKSNVKLNNVEGIVKLVHTSTMYLGDENIPLFDVAIANILPGPLTRLSGLLCLLIKPGGLLCLSGMRHDQLKAVKEYVKFQFFTV